MMNTPRKVRHIAWICAIISVALLLLGNPALAKIFPVPPGDTTALIVAIHTANASPAEDTIVLRAGVYDLKRVNNDELDAQGVSLTGPNGLPVIDSRITIRGARLGPDGHVRTTIRRAPEDAAIGFRIFYVSEQGDLTLDRIRVQNGRSDVAGGPGDCARESCGGGLFNAGGVLRISNSIVANNGPAELGGGIYNRGTLSIFNTEVTGNHARTRGGGLLNHGSATVKRSLFANNWSEESGGAIGNSGGRLELRDSTLGGNRSLLGSDADAGSLPGSGASSLDFVTVTAVDGPGLPLAVNGPGLAPKTDGPNPAWNDSADSANCHDQFRVAAGPQAGGPGTDCPSSLRNRDRAVVVGGLIRSDTEALADRRAASGTARPD